MSIITSIIESVQAAISNEAFDRIQLRDFRTQILDAVAQASADGEITAQEIANIKQLVQTLEINDSELHQIRILVVKDLIKVVLEDHTITDNEMTLYEEIVGEINFKTEEETLLQEDFEKIATIYRTQKNR